jgi:hypothetical protein
MKNQTHLAALVIAVAALLTITGATARIPSYRVVALPSGWMTNAARQSDHYLIVLVDRAGRTTDLCGDISHQCEHRVYEKDATGAVTTHAWQDMK